MANRLKKGTKLQSVAWAEQAAEVSTHEKRMEWIESNVPENFRALVRDHMVGILALKIFEMPTKELRRQAIDDIPLDCDPPWARSLVECYVLHLWRTRKRGT